MARAAGDGQRPLGLVELSLRLALGDGAGDATAAGEGVEKAILDPVSDGDPDDAVVPLAARRTAWMRRRMVSKLAPQAAAASCRDR